MGSLNSVLFKGNCIVILWAGRQNPKIPQKYGAEPAEEKEYEHKEAD